MKMTKPLNWQWHRKWTVAVFFLCIAFVYFIYLPVDYDFDGTVFSSYLRYALLKNDLSGTLQPHHPLHLPLNYATYKLFSGLFGYRVLEYFHLQLFSLLFGLLTLYLSYCLLIRFVPPSLPRRLTGLAGTLFISVTYGIWYYSVQPEVHIIGLFFNLWGIYLLFFKHRRLAIDSFKTSAAAALCFALAAGFHLTNGLILFSLLPVFLIDRISFKRIFRFFTLYTGFLTVGLMTFQLFSHVNLFSHYKNQLVGNSPLAGYKINYWSGSFTFKSLWESFQSVVQGVTVPSAPSLFKIATFLLFIAMVTIIIWGVIKIKGDQRIPYSRFFAWMLPYFIFFTFWDHRNIEFKLNVILPFLLLFIISVFRLYSRFSLTNGETPTKRFAQYTGVAVAILSIGFVASVNYRYFIRPANSIQNNRNYLIAETVHTATPDNALIIVVGCGSDLAIHNKIYLSYFAYRRTFILDWMLGRGMSFDEIAAAIDSEKSKGTPIYIFSTALKETQPVRQLLKNHSIDKAAYFQFIRRITPAHHKTIPLLDNNFLRQI